MHTRPARFAILLLLVAVLSGALLSWAKHNPAPDKTEPFSAAVSERLMSQFRDGLVAHDADTMLAAFDRDNASDYNNFADQLRSFLDTWESFRVHYQVLQTAERNCATACGVATVQFEMEAENVQPGLPAMRRGAQLQLTFQRGAKGWKIVNLTPRELFR